MPANAGEKCGHLLSFKIAQVTMKVRIKGNRFTLKEAGSIFSRVCIPTSKYEEMWHNNVQEKYKWGERFARGVRDDKEAKELRWLDERAFAHYVAYKLYMLQIKERQDKDAYDYLIEKLRGCRYLVVLFSYQMDPDYSLYSELYCAKEPSWFLKRPLWKGPPKMASTN